jgi:hypothetical protein
MSAPTTTKTVTFKSVLGVVPLNLYVDPHPGQAATDRVAVNCDRCGGTGRVVFEWVDGGRCWGCFGTGKSTISVTTARKWAKGEAFVAEYNDQIKAYWAEFEAIQARAAAEAEFAAAWDEAHAEAARRNALVGGFLGAVGDKVSVTGTVNVAKYVEAQSYNRSSSIFLIVTLDNGQVVKTFGSGASLFSLNRNDRVTLTGAVKAHETYRGQDQTVLIRVKAVVLDTE